MTDDAVAVAIGRGNKRVHNFPDALVVIGGVGVHSRADRIAEFDDAHCFAGRSPRTVGVTVWPLGGRLGDGFEARAVQPPRPGHVERPERECRPGVPNVRRIHCRSFKELTGNEKRRQKAACGP
ncbi:hypothetical protein [Nonomuraea sp. NPDC050643]|uniref:hypothetical protein n=1 Tax=Nonomuraea sp. NPDC050643 TaxID=3155660 RepID=UPI0033CFF95A